MLCGNLKTNNGQLTTDNEQRTTDNTSNLNLFLRYLIVGKEFWRY